MIVLSSKILEEEIFVHSRSKTIDGNHLNFDGLLAYVKVEFILYPSAPNEV